MSNSSLVSYTKILNHKNSPRNNSIKKITIHHMAGNLGLDTCYNVLNKGGISANYGIDSNGNIGLYVDEKDRAWTSASPSNDNQAVTIEVANNSGAPNWTVSDAAFNSLINLCVDICQRNGIKSLNYTGTTAGNLTIHKMFVATACPGPYLESKMPEIARLVNERLGNSTSQPSNPQPKPPVNKKPDIIYGVKTLNHGILPDVKNRTDFAGYKEDAIVGVKIGVTSGSIEYRVHLVGKGWLPKVTGANWNDHNNGYAGDGRTPIDAIQIYYHTNTSKTGGKYYEAVYQVKPVKGSYYPNVKDTNWESTDGNNTAGCFGYPFTELKISLE